MKSKEELNALKAKVKVLRGKLAELNVGFFPGISGFL